MARAKKEVLTVDMMQNVIKEIEENKVTETVAIREEEIEHKGYLILIEFGGRVVVSKHGLYVAEFTMQDDAEEYIDGAV